MKWLILLAMLIQSDDLEVARERLKRLEAERQAQAAVEKAQAVLDQQKSLEEIAKSVAPTPDQKVSAPVAPSISLETLNSASGVVGELRPRVLLITSATCGPCRQVKAENPDLIGDSGKPIQVLDYDTQEDEIRALGAGPVIDRGVGLPCWVPIGVDGKASVNARNAIVYTEGYMSKGQVKVYLEQHKVSVEDEQQVVATVDSENLSVSTVAAAVSAALLQQAGHKEEGEYLYGGLFDFEVDVPDTAKQFAAKVLRQETIELKNAGLKIDWSGANRTITFGKGSLMIQPSVKVTVNKWIFSYSAGLDGIEYADDLSSVTVLLSGAPDVRVILK